MVRNGPIGEPAHLCTTVRWDYLPLIYYYKETDNCKCLQLDVIQIVMIKSMKYIQMKMFYYLFNSFVDSIVTKQVTVSLDEI